MLQKVNQSCTFTANLINSAAQNKYNPKRSKRPNSEDHSHTHTHREKKEPLNREQN